MNIYAVGIDMAFANMGIAHVRIHGSAGSLQVECVDLGLVQTEGDGKRRVVRKSSEELRRAQVLCRALQIACTGQSFAFVEVPSGSQSASAARSLGIAVGVLASCQIPIIEVSPMEVKAAVAGKKVTKGASKADIIAWAAERWPEAPWMRGQHQAAVKQRTKAPNRRLPNKILPAGRLLAENEHCADALASVLAGISTPEFQRLIALHEASSPSSLRPASGRRRIGGISL